MEFGDVITTINCIQLKNWYGWHNETFRFVYVHNISLSHKVMQFFKMLYANTSKQLDYIDMSQIGQE